MLIHLVLGLDVNVTSLLSFFLHVGENENESSSYQRNL